jgi:hypothetical protein
MVIGKGISHNVLSHNMIRLNFIYTHKSQDLGLLIVNAYDSENTSLGNLHNLELNFKTYQTSPLLNAFQRLYSIKKNKLPKQNSPVDMCLRKLEEDLLKSYVGDYENSFPSRREYLDALIIYNLNKL